MRFWIVFLLAIIATRLTGAVAVQGTASWYGAEFAGKRMANGRPFNPGALTCASWFYPLGTKLRVTHGNRSVVVTVTDRGPAKRLVKQGRIIDLSMAAFEYLDSVDKGLIGVIVEKL